jgi:putative phosphoribosyl transferase
MYKKYFNLKMVACLAALLPLTAEIRDPGEFFKTREGTLCWRPIEPPFQGREHAGRLLGEELISQYGLETLKDAIVLGCPRGGVLFAKGIVDTIREAGGDPTLDLVISRKIIAPGTTDYGVGAINEAGEIVYMERSIKYLNVDIDSKEVQANIENTYKEILRRISVYRDGRPLISVKDRVVIVVDGVVSGGTMIACVKSVQSHPEGKPKRIIIATPVTTPGGKRTVLNETGLSEEDFCRAALASAPKEAIWNSDDFYQKTKDFEQMTDQEVRDILISYAR